MCGFGFFLFLFCGCPTVSRDEATNKGRQCCYLPKASQYIHIVDSKTSFEIITCYM